MTKLTLALTAATIFSVSAPSFAHDDINLPAAPNADAYAQGIQDEQGLTQEDLTAQRWRGGRGGWGRGGRGWGRGRWGGGWGRRCFAQDAWGRSYNNVRQCMNFSANPYSCRRVCW